MKTTRSAFSGFPRDRYTTLPETDDRLMATKLTAIWRYGSPDIDFDATFAAVRATLLEVFADHDSPSVQASIWIMARAILERHEEVDEVRMVLPEPPPLAGRPVAVRARQRPRDLHADDRAARPDRGDRAPRGGLTMPDATCHRASSSGASRPGRRPRPDRRTRWRSSPTSSAGSGRSGWISLRRRAGAPGASSTPASGPTSSSRRREVREADWTVAPAPPDLDDRRVEITGPAEPKMMINALNSGARVFMADLEDALSPTWANVVGGQAALVDAVRRTLDLRFARGQGVPARRADRDARRPAAWLAPRRVGDAGRRRAGLGQPVRLRALPVPQRRRAARAGHAGRTSTWPSSRSHHEARLWNEVFVHAQVALGIPRGSIRATVLIETILAAFEMDEILYELREHAAGLNAGRWDYLFSGIKKLRTWPELAVPDRAQLTMTVPFMRAYTELLVRTCHRRGAHAIGGMAAFIPNRRDPAVTDDGHGQGPRRQGAREPATASTGRGSPIPTSCPLATEIFDGVLGAAPNQKERLREEVSVERRASCSTCACPAARSPRPGSGRTSGSRWRTSTRGCAASGAAAIDNLMEDAATAEISRSQLWQWRTRGVELADGRAFSARPLRDDPRRGAGAARRGGGGPAGRGRRRCSTDWCSTTTSPSS